MDKTFAERCYEILKKVPRGRVTTYGEIARGLGCGACRAVGGAMNRNPYAYVENQRFSPEEKSNIFQMSFFSDARLPKKRFLTTWVANANYFFRNRNRVPCHRVVGSGGKIGGFASGVGEKIKMLKKEGVDVVDGKVVDFKKKFFKLTD